MVLIYNGRKNTAKMQWINHVPDSKLQSCQVCTTNSTTEKHPFPKNDKNHYLNWALTYNIRHLINVYIYMYNLKNISVHIHIYHIPLFPHVPKKEKNCQHLKTTCNPSTCPCHRLINQLSGHPIERRWPTPKDADHQTTSGLRFDDSITPTRFPGFDSNRFSPQDLQGVRFRS